MSKQLNNNGNVINLNEKINNKPFFRKNTWDDNELEIARRLLKSPHPNIVKIYRVGEDYIDQELVDTRSRSTRLNINDKLGLESAKTHLHKIGVVYLDWKEDNTGRGKDGKIKIFDFNTSGLICKSRGCLLKSNNWNKKPDLGYLARNAMKAGMKTPIRMDNWIFQKFVVF